jgi:acyl-coenzyme A synthetase/AMP-(fatty) acid ligase
MASGSWPGPGLFWSRDPDIPWAQAQRMVTFGELRLQVQNLARTLRSQGIGSGDSVALQGVASFTQLWSIFALWSLGAQVQILDSRLTRAERTTLLKLSRPQFVLSFGRGTLTPPGGFIDECEVLFQRLAGGIPGQTNHCLIQYSWDAAGAPKAIGRTARSLTAEIGRWRNLGEMPMPGENVAVLEPIASPLAFVGGLLCAMDADACVVFPTTQETEAVVHAAAQADVIIGTPVHFAKLTETQENVRLPRLRLAVSGGDVLPGQVADRFFQRYGVRIGQVYGRPETGIIAANLSGGTDTRNIGLPLRKIRIRIAGGVLEVRVPRSSYPYEARRRAGAWISTGDLVSRNAQTGALRLRGRVGHGRTQPSGG